MYPVNLYGDADRAVYVSNLKAELVGTSMSWERLFFFLEVFGYTTRISVVRVKPEEEQKPAEPDYHGKPAANRKGSKEGLRNKLDLKITDTSLNHRVSALLFSYDIVYVGQLAQMSIDQVRRLIGMGEKSVSQICTMLQDIGIVLNSTFPDWRIPSEQEKAASAHSQTVYDETLTQFGFSKPVTRVLNQKGYEVNW
jgi:hypothetical protein